LSKKQEIIKGGAGEPVSGPRGAGDSERRGIWLE